MSYISYMLPNLEEVFLPCYLITGLRLFFIVIGFWYGETTGSYFYFYDMWITKMGGQRMLEKLFKLKENGTDVKTEVIAGLTTFMTMVYIIALNPNLLTGFGAYGQDLWNAVFLATCIGAALGTITLALLANKPFAMAPGMGINTFFAVVVANIAAVLGVSYTQGFQAGLCIILIEGIVFLVLSIVNVREKIVKAIPLGIRLGFILFIFGFTWKCYYKH